jgi:prepilin-type N-terminal cleavage/methylation domain-containing protein
MQWQRILLVYTNNEEVMYSHNNKSSQFFSLNKSSARGFTMVELAIVLVIIGLIVGAVTIGKDVQRGASYQRLSSDFVQAWASAYDQYYTGTGRPPGDNVAAPTGLVNAVVGTPLTGLALRNAMLAAGITLPAGRAEGFEDQYVYLDSNGIPQNVQVSFIAVSWSEAGASNGQYVSRNRNVMVLTGLTPSLANLLDNTFDSRSNASFGKMRQIGSHNITTTNRAAVPWSDNDSSGVVNGPNAKRDEDQVVTLNAYIQMSR